MWSTTDPYIYKVRTQVLQKGKVVDEVWTNTGFRDFRFDAQTGFWLNGKNMKLNGVCEHHDFGCLGAVINEDAMHRKLSKLKAMGDVRHHGSYCYGRVVRYVAPSQDSERLCPFLRRVA